MATEEIRNSLRIAIVGGGVGGGSFFSLAHAYAKVSLSDCIIPIVVLIRLWIRHWLQESWIQEC